MYSAAARVRTVRKKKNKKRDEEEEGEGAGMTGRVLVRTADRPEGGCGGCRKNGEERKVERESYSHSMISLVRRACGRGDV